MVIRDHSPIPEDGRNHSDLWVPYPGFFIRLDAWVGMKESYGLGEETAVEETRESLVLGALAYPHPTGISWG